MQAKYQSMLFLKMVVAREGKLGFKFSESTMELVTGFEKIEVEDEERLYGYKLVPWLSWDQWNFVRDSLFSSSRDSIDAALKRVSAWKSRGCLPVTMEVTAAIIEVQQKDPLFRNGTANELEDSEEMLAMLYTMAIMRLVNGVVEKTRKQRDFSIAEAAESIGLPRMLIDIRHEGSHRDLPSLKLARIASVKALEWLKSYYWEPQKNAIPFQKDVANIRKEIKTKLRELAFHLSIRQASELGSLPMKGRRVKQPETLRGRNKFFSHMADRLKASNSGGSKKQITRTLGTLVQIYSSFPSEVVSVMLQFLLKALDNSSDCNEVASVDNSDMEPSPENFRIFTGTTDVWELVIARFLSKQPELLLTMLEAILEKIETLGATTLDTGDQLAPAQNNAEIRQIEYLTSMVKWLIETFEKERHRSQKGSGDKIQDSSAQTDDVLKPPLKELLRKCLLVLSPGNSRLAESAVLLAQMLGNNSTAERLKKLGMLRLQNVDFVRQCSTSSSLEKVLQQEKSITQAAEKLKSLKQRRMKGQTLNTEARTGDNEEKGSTWTVAKSWNPCPIGMLPRSLGTTGVLPILNKAIVNVPEDEQASQDKKVWELNCSCGKRKASSDDESLLENSIVIEKKRKEMVEVVVPQADDVDTSVESFSGHLRIGGAWMKVREEDVLAIASAVRILV